ncbi:purine nucleoside phosphorylase-like [Dendronephthya gigantea]|uniref:purine nucleoside phosphorylase-like n=1 Tax=Dendronephthya gigantea TaxID=151771 RepID=UPI00106DB16A|nr:purine nucleoside phosphorylase-like [Dendronephthya gigantea]
MAQESANRFSYEELQGIAKFLLDNTTYRPTTGIVCGTGLGDLVKAIENPRTFPYNEIPNFPVSTVKGHAGNLVFGILNGKQVVCMQGRFHYYEGYSLDKVTAPIRVMHLLGIKTLIVTNAAGGINPSFNIGDVMILKDHINFPSLAGANPLRGPNDERFGERFPPMNAAYNRDLQKLAKTSGQELGFGSFLREGVYACVGGPSFETTAELNFLHRVGADAVGMSTAHEVIAAAHCGIQSLGISLITNAAELSYDAESKISHEEVLEVGKKRSKDVEKLVKCVIQKL